MKQRPKFREENKLIHLDDETEMTIKINNEPKTVDTIIKEGDTLQSLSIRYHCAVSELKRLNNLHRDNEIFARRTLKVPYRAFAVAAVHTSGESSPDIPLIKKSVDALLLKQKLNSVTTDTNEQLIDISKSENNFNQIIFNTTITAKPEIQNEIDENSDSDEEIQLLPNRIEVETEAVIVKANCRGDDWGLSWPILLGMILTLAFVVPLIYILYIAEHPERYHHHR